MANPLALISGLLAATCFLLALFILKVGRLHLHRLWACFNISVGIWGTGICLAALSKSHENALRFWQFAHAGGFFVGVFFYHVVHNFCQLKGRKFLFFAYAQAIFFSVVNLVGITGYKVVPTFGLLYYVKVQNLLYVAITILWFLPVIYGHAILFKAMRNATGKKRVQIKYLLVSMFIGFFGGIQHFLPVYNINVYPYGNLLIALYTLIATYAIFKHKLLEIEVIIKRTLVFVGLASFVFGIFTLVTLILRDFLSKYVPLNSLAIHLVSVALIVIGYEPIRRFLIDITDRFLFQKRFDYRQLLKEASREMAAIKSLNGLSKVVVAFLLKKARIRSAAVFAQVPNQGTYTLKASRPYYRENYSKLSIGHPLILLLKEIERPIDLEEVINRMATSISIEEKEKYSEIVKILQSFGAQAVIPSFFYLEKKVTRAAKRFIKSEPNLRSFLFLGPKKSDEPYGSEDFDIFFTLAQESSIAIENARLYDEAVNKAQELQKMNVELKMTHAALLEEKKRAVLAGIGKSMAHEIRNPITPINSHLYFLRKRIQEMESAFEENNRQKFFKCTNSSKELVTEIEKGKDRIQGIVNTLYNLVAQRTDNKVEVKLDMVVESAIAEVQYQTYWETLSQPDIENRIPRTLPFVLGIPQDIQGVFVNLIINALHAMEQKADKKIVIDAMVDQGNPNMIKIEFSDNGCGMTADILEKLFEHGFTTKGKKGTGLGLFYCKNIVEQVHGGTIDVQSELGVGTRFTIRLPRYKKEVEKQGAL